MMWVWVEARGALTPGGRAAQPRGTLHPWGTRRSGRGFGRWRASGRERAARAGLGVPAGGKARVALRVNPWHPAGGSFALGTTSLRSGLGWGARVALRVNLWDPGGVVEEPRTAPPRHPGPRLPGWRRRPVADARGSFGGPGRSRLGGCALDECRSLGEEGLGDGVLGPGEAVVVEGGGVGEDGAGLGQRFLSLRDSR